MIAFFLVCVENVTNYNYWSLLVSSENLVVRKGVKKASKLCGSKCQTSKEQSHGRVEDTKSVSVNSVMFFGNKAEKLGG